jgi:hypothetical protein
MQPFSRIRPTQSASQGFSVQKPPKSTHKSRLVAQFGALKLSERDKFSPILPNILTTILQFASNESFFSKDTQNLFLVNKRFYRTQQTFLEGHDKAASSVLSGFKTSEDIHKNPQLFNRLLEAAPSIKALSVKKVVSFTVFSNFLDKASSLQSIDLSGSTLPVPYFQFLSISQSLQEIYACNTCLDDESVSAFAIMKNLRKLDITGCPKITHEGISELGKSQSLQEIRVTEAHLSDLSLQALTNICTLQKLTIEDQNQKEITFVFVTSGKVQPHPEISRLKKQENPEEQKRADSSSYFESRFWVQRYKPYVSKNKLSYS